LLVDATVVVAKVQLRVKGLPVDPNFPGTVRPPVRSDAVVVGIVFVVAEGKAAGGSAPDPVVRRLPRHVRRPQTFSLLVAIFVLLLAAVPESR
jgi:hypothetical protein